MAADNRDFVNKFANEGGGDVLVEDKRMEELKSATAKTGSQISTSTQYIPLQDTDGNLVKINPASFQEAVRNVLGSLLANNDKGTTISGIPALSGSGGSLDFGSVTAANLASVLGVEKYVGGLYSMTFEITASDPQTNVLDLGYIQNGILIVGCGGGGSFSPGIYSISRSGDVNVILAANGITTVTSNGSSITITKINQVRAAALWIRVQT